MQSVWAKRSCLLNGVHCSTWGGGYRDARRCLGQRSVPLPRQHMGGDLHPMRGDQDDADRFAQEANWLALGHREECLELSNSSRITFPVSAENGRPKLSCKRNDTAKTSLRH